MLSLTLFFCTILFGNARAVSYTTRSDVVASNLLSFEGKKGSWSKWQYCAPGSYGTGFMLKVEPSQGVADDTGANGLKLQCTGSQRIMNEVQNKEGKWGDWSYNWATCPASRASDKYMTAIRTKVDMQKSDGYTGLNSVKAQCSTKFEITVDNPGDDGDWGNWAVCPSKSYICGFQTKVQNDQGVLSDDSALNAVQFACCRKTTAGKTTFWNNFHGKITGRKIQTLLLIVVLLIVAVNLAINLHRFYSTAPRKDLTINTIGNDKYISVDMAPAVDEEMDEIDDVAKNQLIQSL